MTAPKRTTMILVAVIALVAGGVATWTTRAPEAPQPPLAPDEFLDSRVSFSVSDAEVIDVLAAMTANVPGWTLGISSHLSGTVTVTVRDMTKRDALDLICRQAGCRWETRGRPGPDGIAQWELFLEAEP